VGHDGSDLVDRVGRAVAELAVDQLRVHRGEPVHVGVLAEQLMV
jgi:hypothetical protein